MDISLAVPDGAKAIGYRWLEETFGLRVMPHHMASYIGISTERQKIERDRIVTVVHPSRISVEENWLAQVEFAIRHEGLHLGLLAQLFNKIDASPLAAAIQERPNGKYLRKIWYLYEELTGQRLLVPDLTQGNYEDLVDSHHFFTGPPDRIKRQRINYNLPGGLGFCAIVRKTDRLKKFQNSNLDKKCREILRKFPESMFQRAVNFLYRKETKSSYEIENETADQKRTAQFVALLEGADSGNFFGKKELTELQNLIVDPRFANTGYRNEIGEQIYVGQSVGLGKEMVHFAGPKPHDTETLMKAWSEMATDLTDSDTLPPVIAAAVIAFGFVFIHPFSDGNGRIHRFLIHHVLARMGFAPEKVIFPVSSVVVKRPKVYDAALESFSKPLMNLVEYELDDYGRLTVLNDTIDFYRSIDYTLIAETLFEFVAETIDHELPEEFEFLENYDRARREMRQVVELPDRIADLIIRFVLQNNGTISQKKRTFQGFEKLTATEISELEEIISKSFQIGPLSPTEEG